MPINKDAYGSVTAKAGLISLRVRGIARKCYAARISNKNGR